MYRPSDVAWNAITSHLLFVLHHPAALPSVRLHAARALDDILAITQRHLVAGPGDLEATVQHRVLDVQAQWIILVELDETRSDKIHAVDSAVDRVQSDKADLY